MKTTAMFLLGLFILAGCGEAEVQPPPAVSYLGDLSAPLTIGKFNLAKVVLSSDKPTYLAGETVQFTARVTDAVQGGPITYGALELVATFPESATPITFTPANQTDYSGSYGPLNAAAPNIMRASMYQTDTVLQAKLLSQQTALTQEIQNLRDQLAHETNALERAKLKIALKVKEASLADVERNLQGVSQVIGSSSLGLVVYVTSPVTPDPCAANAQTVTLLERTFSRHIFPYTEHRTFTATGPGQICLSIKNDDWIKFRRVTNATVKVDDGTVVAPPEFGSNVTYIEKRKTVTSGNHDLAVKIDAPLFGHFDLKIKFLPDDTTPPSIQIRQPQNGSTLSSIIGPINITYTDNVGIDPSSLSVTLNGKDITKEFAASSSAASAQDVVFSEGTNIIVATIRNLSGNPATATISITVPVGTDPCSPASGSVSVFGPRQFKRKVVPTEEVETINVPISGPVCVRIVNGDPSGKHRVKSAEAKIDGRTIIGRAEFGENVGTILKPIQILRGDQSLSARIDIRSCLGSYFTFEILGVDPNSWAAIDREADVMTEGMSSEGKARVHQLIRDSFPDGPLGAPADIIFLSPEFSGNQSHQRLAEIMLGVRTQNPAAPIVIASDSQTGLPAGVAGEFIRNWNGVRDEVLSIYPHALDYNRIVKKDEMTEDRTHYWSEVFYQQQAALEGFGLSVAEKYDDGIAVFLLSAPDEGPSGAIAAVDYQRTIGTLVSLPLEQPESVELWRLSSATRAMFGQDVSDFVWLLTYKDITILADAINDQEIGRHTRLMEFSASFSVEPGLPATESCGTKFAPPGTELYSTSKGIVNLPGNNGVTSSDWSDLFEFSTSTGSTFNNVYMAWDFFERHHGWKSYDAAGTEFPVVYHIRRSFVGADNQYCPRFFNSYWDPGNNRMLLGNGGADVPSGAYTRCGEAPTINLIQFNQSPDVVFHEYAHAVMWGHNISCGQWPIKDRVTGVSRILSTEGCVIQEGVADVYAKLIHNDGTRISPHKWDWRVATDLTANGIGIRDFNESPQPV